MYERYMNRCIEIAQNGLGTTYPNPLVGAVIVHDGCIIGEGWHRKAGEAHAEANAISAVKDKSLLSSSAIYVNLEPCSHFGRTAPCADLIIEQKIPMVVIGTADVNPLVAGTGIKRLRAAGVTAEVGVLEKECMELNKRFFTYHSQKRPYIILKWAQSKDGFISPTKDEGNRSPTWITSTYCRQLVHKWRTEEQAILVGTQTVVDDNPQLTARDWEGKSPMRLVIDKHNRIPKDSFVMDNGAETIVFTASDSCTRGKTTFVRIDFQRSIVKQILEYLHKTNVQSIIVEGGMKTLQTFIDEYMWDEARIFTGNVMIGEGTPAPRIEHIHTEKSMFMEKDELIILRNP